MASLGSGDLDAYEFKILRSVMGSFSKPEKLRAALDQESRFGWDLLEKLDDSRMRLRRRVECRTRDSAASGDPYRTWAGMSQKQLVPIIVLIVGLVVVTGVFAALLFSRR